MHGAIAASLMCADLLHLKRDIEEMEAAGIEYLHFDIMDGDFVPNFTLGFDLVKIVREATRIPVDVHLMINRPELHIASIDAGPGDIISVHAETTRQLQRALDLVRAKGCKVGLAINPGTVLSTIEDLLPEIDMLLLMTVSPGFAGQKLIPYTIDKIAAAKKLITDRGLAVEIQVDGNVSYENARKMRAAGADIFVAGTSSVFMKDRTIAEGAGLLREAIL